jgi:chemotaxis protein histidine kinase CheA
LGGTISVTSHPGQGTTLALAIPVSDQQPKRSH